MEACTLELYPDKKVYIALFKNVTNASELRQRLINQDSTLACSLVNAKLVINKVHILLAANRAVSDESTCKLKTHNIHSEILYDFGVTNNIKKTFITFGIADDTTDVVAVKIGESETDAELHMKECVQGHLVPFDHLSNITDLKLIENTYQLGIQNQDTSTILSLVAGAMALRGH
ncbi:kinase binding protein CGI-121-domain-containing protein [Parasitella parasitica]|nr:kinase binding protein CGI-121-domain-containing protein [Parasitella parasitica]